jgi:hypothetical protein
LLTALPTRANLAFSTTVASWPLRAMWRVQSLLDAEGIHLLKQREWVGVVVYGESPHQYTTQAQALVAGYFY